MNPHDKLEKHFRINPLQKLGLKKIGVETVFDLLHYLPHHLGDMTKATVLEHAQTGDDVTLFGRIHNLETKKGFKTKITMSKAVLEDATDKIGLVWFNQPYIAKMVHEDSLVKIQGKITEGKSGRYISNPKIEEVSKIPEIRGESLFEGEADSTLYPVYPETKHISSNWIYHHIQKIFKDGLLERITDPIPEHILKKYSLPSLTTAFYWIHNPKKTEHFDVAQKRFAFEEIFFIQIQKQIEKQKILQSEGITIKNAKAKAHEFVAKLPFALTSAQERVINTITEEMERGVPMSRLLEGDVGSGKTAVAGATLFAVLKSFVGESKEEARFGHLQVAYMAPTEILATQHFESFIEYFAHMNIHIDMVLMTGSTCRKFPSKVNPKETTQISKAQAQKWISEGKISFVVGTHALIQKKVRFKNLAYVIIDEQHRFGVRQRQTLARKDGHIPHLLSMTATPIPRTLALTIFGDLDLSLLDEMPKGRKPIITDIVVPRDREKVYEKIREELRAGRQAYVICPRINEPDLPDMPLHDTTRQTETIKQTPVKNKNQINSRRQAGPDKEQTLILKSVTEEAKHLKEKVFPDKKIQILHSKMTPKEKDETMSKFYDGKIDILVSTSVVEVGVNVPNANIIIIEGGERFGLSQLHQLRGRVLRGTHQAYCYIFADAKSDKTIERLKAFKNAKNGFELAELDMQGRGIGTLGGGKQWGVSDIAMDALRNIKMVEIAREEARNIVTEDLELSHYPFLKERVTSKQETHFE